MGDGKPRPPNNFFSSMPLLRARAVRMRAARFSSNAMRCPLVHGAVVRSIHRLFVHSYGNLCHLLHRAVSGKQRQVLEAKFADDLDDGFLQVPTMPGRWTSNTAVLMPGIGL